MQLHPLVLVFLWCLFIYLSGFFFRQLGSGKEMDSLPDAGSASSKELRKGGIHANRSLPSAKLLPPVSADVTILTKATAFPARSLGGQGAQASLLRAEELILLASCLLRLWSLSNEVSQGGGSRAGGSDKDETK